MVAGTTVTMLCSYVHPGVRQHSQVPFNCLETGHRHAAGASPITGGKGNALKDALAKLERVATPQQYSLGKADAARRDRGGATTLASQKSHAAKRLQASFDQEAGVKAVPTKTNMPLPCAARPRHTSSALLLFSQRMGALSYQTHQRRRHTSFTIHSVCRRHGCI